MASLIDRSGNLVYFGQLSWANLVDWLITFTLSAVLLVAATVLGGVRPEAQSVILPGICLLLVLHGVWYMVSKEASTRLSQVPLACAPLLLWMVFQVNQSPSAWRGEQQLIYVLEAIIFFAVFANNARARLQVWTVLFAALIPLGLGVFNAFYQFFQNPGRISGALTDYTVELSPEFLGRATGTFADPESFVVLLLLLGPGVLFAGIVPRFPMIIRVMCCYIALMVFLALVMAQVIWALPVLLVNAFALAWLSTRKLQKRIKRAVLGVLLVLAISFSLGYAHNTIRDSALSALENEGEGARLALWREASRSAADSGYLGLGAGSSELSLEQSARLVMVKTAASPMNDYLLVFLELGVLGLLLLLFPIGLVLVLAIRRWRAEPKRARLTGRKGAIMPPQCFFISIALLGCLGSLLCVLFVSVLEVPALLLYVALFWGLLAKTCFNRRIELPQRGLVRLGYCVLLLLLALGFYRFGSVRLKAQALELEARQRLDHLIEGRVHLSGNSELLDDVIVLFEEATNLHPENADAWIGLSAAYNQLFFRNPSAFREVGELASNAADQAVLVGERYWRSWAQLGISHALSGDVEGAESALTRSLELAPNSSNAQYYWASYLSHRPGRIEEAKRAVHRAIEINPENAAAIRLRQKLLIL